MGSKKKAVKRSPQVLNRQELEDIWSALSYFISEYPDEGSRMVKASMKRIALKIRKYIRAKGES